MLLSFFLSLVAQGVQYGPSMCALATYLLHEQLIPMERTAGFFRDVFGQGVSEGFLGSLTQRASTKLEQTEASTEDLTCYGISEKRGGEAMEEMNILPRFGGIAVHDHGSPYFTYENCSHALCNAHHLRELTYAAEVLKEGWAQGMKSLLKEIHRKVEACKTKGQSHLSACLAAK